MTKQYHVFISSKMVELAEERHVLQSLLPKLGNDLVQLKAWAFEEDAPASNQPIREIYLDALQSAALYIGLFWNDYGEWTVDEFQKATEWGIDRHIYVKDIQPEKRDKRLEAFLDTQSDVISGITPKWFRTPEDLKEQVTKSVSVWLQDHLQKRPGDTAAIHADFSDDIPDLPKKLIGRDEVANQIRGFLDDELRVLLQGFGGTGKTAIAATVAADWLEDDQGDVLWLKVGSEDANTIMEALAKPFDKQQDIASADGKAKAKALRTILTDNDISLIVLDDVWDGAALNEVLRGIPRHTPVLVTARQRYALDDIVEVGRMGETQAVNLLSFIARQKYTDDLEDARELCRQLGYHAFALEVAGNTLKVDQIRPQDLLQRIAETPHEMTMPGDFAEEGRSSITELLDASLYALDAQERRTFLTFGRLFAPDTTLELLAQILDQPVETVQESLVTLQRRGLAERLTLPDSPTSYFRIHNLSHSYAKAVEKAQGRGPEAMTALIADHVNVHAEDVDALHIIRDTWKGAAQAAIEQDQQDLLVRIMEPLVGAYLAYRGHDLPFLRLVEKAVEYAAGLGSDYDASRDNLLGRLGTIYYQRGDFERAVDYYQQVLALAEQRDDKARQVQAMGAIGALMGSNGTEKAESYLKAAYQLADELDDDFLRAWVLENQAFHAQAKGDYESTKTFSTQQIRIAENIGDVPTQVFALNNLGTAEKILGNHSDALAHHQQMLGLAQAEGNDIWIARALQGIGEDYHAMGDREEAQKYLHEALDLFRECGVQANVTEIEDFLRIEQYI